MQPPVQKVERREMSTPNTLSKECLKNNFSGCTIYTQAFRDRNISRFMHKTYYNDSVSLRQQASILCIEGVCTGWVVVRVCRSYFSDLSYWFQTSYICSLHVYLPTYTLSYGSSVDTLNASLTHRHWAASLRERLIRRVAAGYASA